MAGVPAPSDATLKLHWFLPTGGDSRDVLPAADGTRRPPDVDYLAQVARAADTLGFDGMLTPCGTMCEDAWLATAALIGETRRIKFLVAFRPGLLSPTLAAQMASTYQRVSRGRLLLNIVTGADVQELGRFGDWLDKDTRYERTGEFLQIMRGCFTGQPTDFEGTHYRVEHATTRAVPDPIPEIYFGGASPAAEAIAAKHVDVYLAWGEPPDMVRERLDRMRQLAADEGRTLRFGIRFHVITRDRSDEAWAVTDRILAGMSPEAIAAAQADFAATASVGQQRMAGLHGGSTDQLEIHPNIWAGIGLVRGGAGTALVGSHEEVADRIEEYHALGFDEFILSGYPHLEEAYWFGEGVMPLLRRRGLLRSDAGDGEAGAGGAASANAAMSSFR
jgi:alkanesulfonate monooxygenase